jgi:hypothetical protein
MLDRIDPEQLAAFRSGLRRRHSDDDLLAALSACARRLGRTPTMRELAADAEAGVHPQTLVERFGSWSRATRLAGLVPRRNVTREELLALLRALGDRLGRVPTASDIEAERGRMPSKSLYWHTFGSLGNALREAGFDVPAGEERVERAVERGVELARAIGRLPRFADWAAARSADPGLPSEWQVYRLFSGRAGAWAAFQYLVRERLLADGIDVAADGRVRIHPRARAPLA